MKEQPFYIGQKVVCIKSDSTDDGSFSITEGQFYFIKKTKQCKCGLWKVDVGLSVYYTGFLTCRSCKNIYDISSTVWCDYHYFAPIQEGFQAISFEKVLEQELSSVN